MSVKSKVGIFAVIIIASIIVFLPPMFSLQPGQVLYTGGEFKTDSVVFSKLGMPDLTIKGKVSQIFRTHWRELGMLYADNPKKTGDCRHGHAYTFYVFEKGVIVCELETGDAFALSWATVTNWIRREGIKIRARPSVALSFI